MNGIAPLPRPWHGRILLLNHTRKIGVPSRTLTGNLTLRTRLLYGLSYGDKESNPWPVSSTGSHPALSKVSKELKELGRSIYFAFRDSKWYARPVTLRNPALI